MTLSGEYARVPGFGGFRVCTPGACIGCIRVRFDIHRMNVSAYIAGRRPGLVQVALIAALALSAISASGAEQREIEFPNGDVYVGDVVDGQRTGRGRYTWVNGDRYEGDFVGGELHGRGTFSWADGRVYEGAYDMGRRTGLGTFTWPGGDVYEGEFIDGVRTGEGEYRWQDGSSYRGEFVAGRRQGLGTFRWPDGARYTGEYADDVREGWGEYKWPDGSRYVGGYQGDRRSGQGTLIASDGTLYRGGFLDNQEHGVGVRVGPKGRRLTLERWSAGAQQSSQPIAPTPGCELEADGRGFMALVETCIDGLAHGRGDAVSLDGLIWYPSARFVLGRIVEGEAVALGQPPEGGA